MRTRQSGKGCSTTSAAAMITGNMEVRYGFKEICEDTWDATDEEPLEVTIEAGSRYLTSSSTLSHLGTWCARANW